MGIEPKIPKRDFFTKRCGRCGLTLPGDKFSKTHSPFYSDGYLPICNGCIQNYLKENEFSWDSIDKLCQYAGIPFIVKEWSRLLEANGEDQVWAVYSNVFAGEEYKGIGWGDYFKQYKKLREASLIEDELPYINQEHIKELKETWGANYSEEELNYLEDLYKGLLLTQNVNGALQIDQARKICKLSLEIDSRIRAGDKDVDKFLASYDKLVKTAEFTPKNTKNAADFDSFAEVGYWLEKRGRQNKYYDNTTRDIIDETLKNIENFTQRLYVNEGGIGDEITQRLKSLQVANEAEESLFDLPKEVNLDEYDNAGFSDLDNEEFKVEVDENE